MLRFADLDADQPLLDAARDWAPRLLAEQPEAVQAHLQRWLSGREQFLCG